jgi:hypothetical protein
MKKKVKYKTSVSSGIPKRVKIRIFVALILLILILLFFAIYVIFFVPSACDSFECYETALSQCEKVWTLKENEDYIWRYEIINTAHENACNVNVRLLKIKKGETTIQDLQNKEMVCVVKKRGDVFPEEEMARCSGPLREELQEIIIDRLHNYLLDSIGEINQELTAP